MIIAVEITLIVTLVFVIVDDLRHYRIRNDVILILLGLTIAKLVFQANAGGLIAHGVFAVFAFGALLVAFSRNWIGGGDTKLLTVAFLQIGPWAASSYAVFLLVLTLTYWAGATLGLFPVQRTGGRLKIPFGPCIAGAWIMELGLSAASRSL